MSYSDQILGAAVFDLNGLPKNYYVSVESADITWMQMLFQALGLQALLTCSFKLKKFHYAVIQGGLVHAIIVRQSNQYLALLISQTDNWIAEELIQWVVQLDPTTLDQDSRFHSV